MTETPLPKGITRVPATGHFRVRVKRDGIWHLGGYHAALPDAVASLDALLAALPPPTRRQAAHPSWAAEQARQRAAAQGKDLTGIYPTGSGWSVKYVRDQQTFYVGHYPTLDEAILERDGKMASPSPGRGRTKGAKSKKPRRKPAADLCPAAL